MFNRDRKSEFEEALLEHMDSVYNFALRMTRNREDAGDLAQDAALRAFRFFDQFEQGTSFKSWILTIVRNTFINQYRKKAKEPPKVNYEEAEHLAGVAPADGLSEELFGENIQRAIEGLPEEMRATLILFYVEGLAYKEIAQVMTCPIGTVMSRLHMARQILRKKLTEFSKNKGHSSHGLSER